MKLAHGALIIVADGGRHLVLENRGDEGHLDLRRLEEETLENPPSRAHGGSAPGQFTTPRSGRGAGERPDKHETTETRFSAALLSKLEALHAAHPKARFVIVCDPETLGEIRQGYTHTIKAVLDAEFATDLTGHPIAKIEDFLRAQ